MMGSDGLGIHDREGLKYASWSSSSPSPETTPSAQSASTLASTGIRTPSVLRKIEKWVSTPSIGQPVWPSRFIPMKSPLTERLTATHYPGPEPCPNPHTIPTMLQNLEQEGIQIGMVVNLSIYGDLYASDMERCQLKLCHVPVDSKKLPSAQDVRQVIGHANHFWTGYNRTGFVICSYLIEVCGLSVDAALASFAHSRPQGINHEEFLVELRTRYQCLPPAPIPAFHSTHVYSEFYRSRHAGEKQINALHAAAGWAKGTWAASVADGKCLQRGRAESMPDSADAQQARIATNDSHVEGLLG